MRALVLGESESIALKARDILLRAAYDCPVSNVMRLHAADKGVAQSRPELIIFCLSPDPIRSLESLVDLRAISRTHIIAVGPAHDPKLILDTLRVGANEFIDETAMESDLCVSVS